MIKKVQYNNLIERDEIIKSNTHLFLVEEQNITEGDFLIFSDIKSIEEVVKQLQQDSITTFDVLATIYEELTKGSV